MKSRYWIGGTALALYAGFSIWPVPYYDPWDHQTPVPFSNVAVAQVSNPGIRKGSPFVAGDCVKAGPGANQITTNGGTCAAAAPVQSVFGRTGTVIAAGGDYTVAQVTGAAPLASPTFTGTPAAPTPATADNTTKLATTAYVQNNLANYLLSATAASTYAPLASPALTGVPTSPTAANGTNTTQIASTAFVQNAVAAISTGVTSFNGRTAAVVPTIADYTSALINYTANYTGALTRTTQLKLSGRITVDDFTGADCSGATDSSGALQAALNAGTAVRVTRTSAGAVCTLKLSANVSVPTGTILTMDCGATFSLDSTKTLTFVGGTNDTSCQKWAATGANSGAGSGTVTGLKFNRPEYWGSFGDCNIGGSCTHDDSTFIQQAINSAQASATSDGMRPTVRLQGGKGYGVDTAGHTGAALTITPSLIIPLDFGGGSHLNGGDGNGGSWIIGKAGFTGDVLNWAGTVANQNDAAYIHDFGLYSFTANQANSCFKIGATGSTTNINNNNVRAVVTNLYIANCTRGIVLVDNARIRGINFSNIGIVLPAASAQSGISIVNTVTSSIGELKLNDITIDASACVASGCFGFLLAGTTGGNFTDIDFSHLIVYPGASAFTISCGAGANCQDFWCDNCQLDGITKTGISITCDGGSTTCANINFKNQYIVGNGSSVGFNAFEALATNSALLQGVSVTGSWFAALTPSQVVKVSGAKNTIIDENRFSDINIATGTALLIENCLGSCSGNNNRLWRTSTTPLLLNFVALSGTTDYSQACNNSGGGYNSNNTGPVTTVVSVSTASGTHNIASSGGLSTCPNN